MPKFIYTVLVLNVFLWWFTYKWLVNNPPVGFENIATLLLLLFFSLGLTLSYPFYFYFFHKAPSLTKLRAIFRRSLKWGFFLSAGFVFILMMRALQVYNIINLLLFGVLYYALYLQLRAKR